MVRDPEVERTEELERTESAAAAAEPDPVPGGDAATEGAEPPAAASGAAAEGTSEVEELRAALAEATAQRDEYLGDLKRLQAEFENYRKRMMREGAVQRDAGVELVISRLLDVLDDFDMALLSLGQATDVEALRKGIELLYSKLWATVEGFGLRRIDETDVAFDPTRHEAVVSVDAPGGRREQPWVVEVLRAGYELGGRVIRPAMVKVER